MNLHETYMGNISTPPSYEQTKYLYHVKAEIMEKNFPSSIKRVAVKLSNTTFILCEPQEKGSHN